MSFRLSAGWTTSGLCPRPELSLRSRSARSGDVVSNSINAAGALAPQDYISLGAYFGCLINHESYAGALHFRFAQVRRSWLTSPAAASTIEAFTRLRASTGYVTPASSLGRFMNYVG